MGILGNTTYRIRNFYEIQHFNRFFQSFLFGIPFVQPGNFHNLFAYSHNRVQAGHRFLENHGDPVAADFPHFIFRKFQQVLTLKINLPACNLSCRTLDKSYDGEGCDGFPAS